MDLVNPSRCPSFQVDAPKVVRNRHIDARKRIGNIIIV